MGSNDFPTYEDSAFIDPAPLAGGDEAKLEEIWSQEYSLNELLDPKNFKSYEELKATLNRVLEVSSDAESPSKPAANDSSNVDTKKPAPSVRSTSTDDPALKTFASLLQG